MLHYAKGINLISVVIIVIVVDGALSRIAAHLNSTDAVLALRHKIQENRNPVYRLYINYQLDALIIIYS